MKRLRFGLIGCGRISYKHIEALIKNADQIELVAVCDPIMERAQTRKTQYEAEVPSDISVFTDHRDLLADPSIEAVAIATESGYHAAIALEAIAKKKHVLIEKPMAMTVAEIDEINRSAEEQDVKVGVCHQNRFNPVIQKLRRAIEEERFGRISNITARILWNRDQNYYDQAPWRGTYALDGGTLMNQCIHNIDLLQWMMNSKVLRVKSERDTFFRNIEMEDFGALLMRFENGAIGLVEGSAIVYPKNLEETLSVFGEKGTVIIGGLAVNEIKTWIFEDERNYDQEDQAQAVDSVYGHGHTPLYRDFSEAVRDDREPYINGREGRKSVEIITSSYSDPTSR